MRAPIPAFRRLVFAAIFLTAFGTYVMRAVNSGALNQPPESGDGHDYDAIAFNVWQGRGFALSLERRGVAQALRRHSTI